MVASCFYICSVVLELFEISRLEKTFHRVTRYRALISYQSATRKGNRGKEQPNPSVRPSHKWTPIKLLDRKGISPLIFSVTSQLKYKSQIRDELTTQTRPSSGDI